MVNADARHGRHAGRRLAPALGVDSVLAVVGYEPAVARARRQEAVRRDQQYVGRRRGGEGQDGDEGAEVEFHVGLGRGQSAMSGKGKLEGLAVERLECFEFGVVEKEFVVDCKL